MKRIIYLVLTLCLMGQNLSIKSSDAAIGKLVELKNSVMAKTRQDFKIGKKLGSEVKTDIKSIHERLQSLQTKLVLVNQIIDETTQALAILDKQTSDDELSVEFRNLFRAIKNGSEIEKSLILKEIELEKELIEKMNNRYCVIN